MGTLKGQNKCCDQKKGGPKEKDPKASHVDLSGLLGKPKIGI
jgi:hypothetical protein